MVRGRHYEFVSEVEMYDISAGQWKVLPYVNKQGLTLLQPGAQQVSSSKVLIFGGLAPAVDDEESSELDPEVEAQVLAEDGLRTRVSD